MPRQLRGSPMSIFALGFAASFALSYVARSNISGAGSAGVIDTWRATDAKYLGNMQGDTPPKRLDGYKYKTNEYQVSQIQQTVKRP